MVPIQVIAYNGCTQNIHQRPHCLHIALPWAKKKRTVPQEHRRKRTYATDTDDSVQWLYTEYPPTSQLFVYYIIMGKQSTVPQV